MNKASKQKSAGRPSVGAKDGNVPVIVDLGETIEKKLRAAGLRTEVGKSSPGPAKGGNVKPSQGTPGLDGYRPWYSSFSGPGLGQQTATEKRFQLIPEAIRQVKTTEALTGLGLGLLGNRAMVRLTPNLWDNDSKLVHEGLAFVAGLVPLLVKRNATTLGVAAPGAIYLGGSLIDKIFDWAGIPKGTALKGSMGAPRADAALAARQKLAAIQQKINLAQAQAPRPQVPRVVAQPQYAS